MRSSWLAAVVLVCPVAIGACAAKDGGTAARDGGGAATSPVAAEGGSGPNADNKGTALGAAPFDRGVILVHAARVPAFRLCFSNDTTALPQPDSIVMPDANVVGLEVGSAVRLAPRTAPGKVYLFEERVIRPLYPTFGGKTGGLTCDELLRSTYADNAYLLGELNASLESGVHLLAVTGCPKSNVAVTYTKAECGSDYVGSTGNLKISDQLLQPAQRGPTGLPVQVLHLSPGLESARTAGLRTLSVGFVRADAGPGVATIATDPPLYGPPAAQELVDFNATKDADYLGSSFRVSVGPSGDAGADAGLVFVHDQSLATTQRLSAPGDLPANYFSKASNYVLLLLGAPDPRKLDGGADDDELKRVHLLAVPVSEPEADAGADGGDAGRDGN